MYLKRDRPEMTENAINGHKNAKVFISAAEQSADLHAANLIRAIHRVDPSISFVGVAGSKMQQAGCRAIDDMTTHAAMASGVIRVIPRALELLKRCKACLSDERFDLAIVVDSPTLNLPVAKHARNAGIPVLYYIAPQVWAWAEGRIRRVRARVDQLAVILPFEEQYFAKHGLKAEYVGHPLFDCLSGRKIDPRKTDELRCMGKPIISILPGSRGHVVSEVFPGQVQVAQAIARRFPNAHFCVSAANEKAKAIIEPMLQGANISASLHVDQNGTILSASDLALVASGTATLETAFYHVPMIVMYNSNWLFYELAARWLIKTKLFSLVNILAGRKMVPEFMPYYRSTEPITAKAIELLENESALQAMRFDIAATIDPIVRTGASDNTAKIVLRMLEARQSVLTSH